MQQPETKHFYEFGAFRLDSSEKVLSRDGETISLTPKVFDTLEVFVENAGRLIEKDELMQKLWQDRFVEESNLTFNIKMLRKALGDSASKPIFIETVPRRGYRFIAEVNEFHDAASPAVKNEKNDYILPPRQKPYFLIVMGIILLTSIFGVAFVWFRGENKQLALKQSRVTRLTNNGKVTNAAVSSDGKYLVYAQQEGIGESLWLRHVTTGSQMQILSAQPVNFVGLTVSPDNNYIYYSIFSKNSVASTLSRIPLLGGSPLGIPNVESDVTISFAPDGKRFAFTESRAALKETYLKTADAGGQQQVTLITTKGDNRAFQVFQASPVAWSPDGETIACVVRDSDENTSFYKILLVNPGDGTEKYLSENRWNHIRSIVWKNAETLALINSAPNSKQIWEISRATGDAKQLTDDLSGYQWLGSSGGNLFTVQQNAVSSLHVAEFAENAKMLQPQQIFSESGAVENVVWSLNGKIYYNSWTSGKNEIWRMNADGTTPEQLTTNANLNSAFAVSPSDGTLVFSSLENGKTNLRRADSDGQNVRSLTDGTSDYLPRFSPDGKSVIFQRDSVLAAIWRVSADGNQPATKIVEPLASHPAVSPDGKTVAYHFMDHKDGKPRWKMALTDNETGKIINKLDFPISISERSTVWHPNGKFLTMIFNNGENVGLLLLSPTDGKYQTIDNIAKDKITSFAWSPDGNRFAFSHITEIRDVVSMSGF